MRTENQFGQSEQEEIEAPEWDSPHALEAISKYGHIMGENGLEAMDWLLGTGWGVMPSEVPARVKAAHGIDIPPNMRTGLYTLRGMWEVEKQRRYEASNKALLDEYDDGRDPAAGGH